MNGERVETRTDQEKPTNIPLFRYGPATLERSRDLYQQMAQFSHDEAQSKIFWQSKLQQVQTLQERLTENVTGLSRQTMAAKSAVATGRAYLKFLDDFLPKSLTPPQIFDFFKLCLRISMEGTITTSETAGSEVESSFLRRSSKDFKSQRLLPLFERAIRKPPDWFNGSSEEYSALLDRYSAFTALLNPEYQSFSSQRKLKVEKDHMAATIRGDDYQEEYLGATTAEGVPDWLEDDRPPDKEEVAKEQLADAEELKMLHNQRARLIRQFNYLGQSFNQKKSRSTEWFGQRWHGIRVESPSLGDFLSYLYLASSDKDYAIRYFVDLKDRVLDQECWSLWFEENFKTAGITLGDNVTVEGRQILTAFLLNRDEFRSFREINKKGYNSLKFNLGSLIEHLMPDDISLIFEFLDENQNQQAGALISFMADLSVERLTGQNIDANPSLEKATLKYREYLRRFLRHHWEGLYQQFRNRLFSIDDSSTLSSTPLTEKEPDNIANEFEREFLAIEKGHLKDWSVLYSTDQTTNQGALIEVSGQTLEERSEFLQQMIAHLGISCSIKPASVIHALDWKTQVPPNIEQIVPSITVKGERWKKIKRQNVRILYQKSDEDKKVIFFIYQKKAWSYDLPAA